MIHKIICKPISKKEKLPFEYINNLLYLKKNNYVVFNIVFR